MRANPSESLGQAGVSIVKTKFNKLGWAVVEDLAHDIGIDLFVRPRNRAGIEYGVIMGVQVKAGCSYFTEPAKDGETSVGWWYREGGSNHFDYWLKNAFQTIIVLVDVDLETCHWGHVRDEALVSTGKGVKIRIDRKNQIDSDSCEALTEIALLQKQFINWYGNPNEVSNEIAEGDLARTALMAPKMLAPRLSGTLNEVSGFEALALLVLMNESMIDALSRSAQEESQSSWPSKIRLIDRQEAKNQSDWGWIATYTLFDCLTAGDGRGVSVLKEVSRNESERVATLIIGLMVDRFSSRPVELPKSLEELGIVGNVSEVDRAWFDVHRAAILYEHGQSSDAFELAMKCQAIGRLIRDDVTAQSVSAVASLIALNTFGLLSEGSEKLVQNLDNAAFWWRDRQIGRALEAHLDQSYRAALRNRSKEIVGFDGASSLFWSASMISVFMGDIHGWRRSRSLLAKHKATSRYFDDGERDFAGMVHDFWEGGDSESLMAILDYLPALGKVRDGVLFFNSIDLGVDSLRSLLCTIRMVEGVADYLDVDRAREVADWLADLILAPTPEQMMGSQKFDRVLYGIQSLGSVLQSVTEEDQVRLISRIVDSGIWVDRNDYQCLLPLLNGASQDVLRGHFFDVLEDWTECEDASFAYFCCKVLAGASVRAQARVLTDLAAGVSWALNGFRTIADLPSSHYEIVRRALFESADLVVSDALRLTFSSGSFDVLDWLIQLALESSSDLCWNRIVDFLRCPLVAWGDLERGILRLTGAAEVVPHRFRAELESALRQLAESDHPFARWGEGRDLELLRFAYKSIGSGSVESPLLEFVGEGGRARSLASEFLYMLDASTYSLLIFGLIGDKDLRVRANALSVAAAHLDQLPTDLAFPELLVKAFVSDNPVLIKGFISGFSQLRDVSPWLYVVSIGANSCSSRVRNFVRTLIGSD